MPLTQVGRSSYHIRWVSSKPFCTVSTGNVLSTDGALVSPSFTEQVLSGKFVLRFAVGAPLTEEQHIFAAWKILQDLATKQLLGSS
jgi:tyrosine decarboxylase